MEGRLPRPEIRPEFRARLRADLVREAAALAEGRRRRTLGSRVAAWWSGAALRPALVAAGIALLLVGGTGAAAAGSLPGDVAYPVKRAAEQIELLATPSEAAKVRVLTAQAERRLDELQRAAARAEKAPTATNEYAAAVERLAQAVRALRSAEPEERREAVDRVVEAARGKHVEVLERLRERLPEGAQKGVDRALEQHGRLAPGREKERGDGDRDQRDRDKDADRPKGKERQRASEPPRASPSERPRDTAPATPRGGRPTPRPTR